MEEKTFTKMVWKIEYQSNILICLNLQYEIVKRKNMNLQYEIVNRYAYLAIFTDPSNYS